MQGAGSVVRAEWWLIGGVLLGTCLLCAVPTPARAHPVLQRSDPANNAVPHTAPESVRLWFSAVLDPAFGTALVENTASASVNERDAQLVSGNARELEIPLASHLAPGTYAVVWRVVSDADGYILSGSLLFAVAGADGSVPGQAMQSDVLLAQRSSAQNTTLTLLVGILAALALVGWMVCPSGCLHDLLLGRTSTAPDTGCSSVSGECWAGAHWPAWSSSWVAPWNSASQAALR